jgi:hypothetical protein
VHPQPGFNGWYKGVIDEATIYRRALSSTEITALYAAGSASKCKTDTDNDGLTDLQENFLGTTSNDTDTDNDGLTDGDEVFVHNTNPNDADTDDDNLPDGWEWNHFGNFAQTASGDYDNDGVNNGTEYSNGTDPNDIKFSMGTTNKCVSTSLTTAELRIDNGVPFFRAVLVDSTNFATASWSAFSSTSPNLNLGSVEGWHDVWVGLRGLAPTSGQTWQWMRLKLDLTPPTIMPTNPDANVSQPMIQLNGYSLEPLSRISCQVSNSSGVFSNQLVVVSESFYDTNTYEYTTNWFQGFDIGLIAGANRIEIQATDQAGNLATTNCTFTLASDTTAPVVELWWPQDNAELIGETFTWRGLVDDFTATLTATIVDAGNNATEVTATVERSGEFWFEDLPLAAGISTLTLKAEDYWGNIITTTISVIRSSVELTIDPVDENVLNDPTITVTGSINVNDHSVWVNGVKATLNGDGTWQAVEVPVPPGGTAVIQARAIPNSDNGGNGSGGGGGGSGGAGNPTSAQQKDKSKEEDKRYQFYIYKDDVEKQLNDRTARTEVPPNWHTAQYIEEYEHHFTNDPQTSPATAAGTGRIYYVQHFRDSVEPPSDIGPCNSTFFWNASTAESAYVTPCTGNPYWMPAPPVVSEHCDVKDPPPTFYVSGPLRWDYKPYERKAQTKWRLFTGGKAEPKRQALWGISGQASEIVGKRATRPFTGLETREIAKPQIKVFDKALASDGIIFKTLPNGQHIDVPFEVTGPGSDFYTFSPGGTPYYLISRCVCPRPDLDRTTVGVGEEVNLKWSSSPKGADSIYPANEPITWTAGAGSVVPTNTWPTKFTAPSNEINATLTATVRDEECAINFSVVAPTGVKTTIRGQADLFDPLPKVGAGMQIDVVLQPTTVSFNKVQIKEPAAAAVRTGYYINNPPPNHDNQHGADVWYSVNCANFVLGPPANEFDHAWSDSGAIGTEGGTYTWPISPVWRVGAADTTTDPLNGWTDQVHTLFPNGTIKINKLGRQVIRGPNEPRGTAQ